MMDRLLLLKMLQWIQEKELTADLEFGLVPRKSSVVQLCRLITDLG
jgi:hypothetical protein